jgi:hypothetical protein
MGIKWTKEIECLTECAFGKTECAFGKTECAFGKIKNSPVFFYRNFFVGFFIDNKIPTKTE